MIAGCALLIVAAQAAHAAPPVTAMAFAPDGQHIIAASQAGIAIFAWPELRRAAELPTQLIQVHDIEFSPKGDRMLVVGGTPAEEGLFEVFAWPERTLAGQGSVAEDVLYGCAWRPDGTGFATVSLDGSLEHFASDGSRQGTITGHSMGVTDIAFVADDTVLSASLDQTLRLWTLSTGTLQRTLNNHTQAIHDIAVRPPVGAGPPVAVSVASDRTIRLWQPTIGRLMRFVRLDEATPLAVRWTPDGQFVLVVCTDGQLLVIEPGTVKILHRLQALDGWAYSLTPHPREPYVVIGGAGGQIVSLKLPTEEDAPQNTARPSAATKQRR